MLEASADMRRPMKAIPGELEALLKAAKSIGLLSNMQASSMRNDVQTGRLTAGVVTAQLKKRLREAKLKWEQEKTDARAWAKGRWVRAIFDFQPTEEVGDTKVPDLSFMKEDIIQLTMGEPMKWWRGTLATSPSKHEAEFPKNYVELLEKKVAERDHNPLTSGGSTDELRVFAGDTIVIVRGGPRDEMWHGFVERRAGEVKAFPRSCLEPPPPPPAPEPEPLPVRPASPPSPAHVSQARKAEAELEPAATTAQVEIEIPASPDPSDMSSQLAAAKAELEQLKESGPPSPKPKPRLASVVRANAGKSPAKPRFSMSDAAGAVLRKLKEEEADLLAQLAALQSDESDDDDEEPPKRPCKGCLGCVALCVLVLALCTADLVFQIVKGVPKVSDERPYRHADASDEAAGNGTSWVEQDGWGWPRVKRNLEPELFFEIWDPSRPCGFSWAELQGEGAPDAGQNDTIEDLNLKDLKGVLGCDGDSGWWNILMHLLAGGAFGLIGLFCMKLGNVNGSCEKARRRRPLQGLSWMQGFFGALAVLVAGEVVNVFHNFIAAGRNSDPSTVDLWLATVGMAAVTVPVACVACSQACRCCTNPKIRQELDEKRRLVRVQKKRITKLEADVAQLEAGRTLTDIMHDEDEPEPEPEPELRVGHPWGFDPEPEPEPEPAPDRGELEQELSKLSKRQLRQRAEASVRHLPPCGMLKLEIMTQIGCCCAQGVETKLIRKAENGQNPKANVSHC